MSFEPAAIPGLRPETLALHAGQKPDPATIVIHSETKWTGGHP